MYHIFEKFQNKFILIVRGCVSPFLSTSKNQNLLFPIKVKLDTIHHHNNTRMKKYKVTLLSPFEENNTQLSSESIFGSFNRNQRNTGIYKLDKNRYSEYGDQNFHVNQLSQIFTPPNQPQKPFQRRMIRYIKLEFYNLNCI